MMHEQSPNSFHSPLLSIQDERKLLQQIAQGNRTAYTQLYTAYLPRIYQYVFRFTKQSKAETDEIVQEVFLSIWEKKETLIAIQKFESYLYKIAKNKLLNKIKHNEFKQQLHQTFSKTIDLDLYDTETSIAYSEYHKTALAAIDKLPEKRKKVFLLSTQLGLSLDEIAQELGVSKSRVKQQLYEAKNYIKKYLHKNAEWLLMAILYAKY